MSTNRLALRAYRALLTQARAVGARGSDTLTVRLPVEGSWGHGQTFHGSEKYRRAVQRYLGDLAQTSQVAFLSADVEPVRLLACSLIVPISTSADLLLLANTQHRRVPLLKHSSRELSNSSQEVYLASTPMLIAVCSHALCSCRASPRGVP